MEGLRSVGSVQDDDWELTAARVAREMSPGPTVGAGEEEARARPIRVDHLYLYLYLTLWRGSGCFAQHAIQIIPPIDIQKYK